MRIDASLPRLPKIVTYLRTAPAGHTDALGGLRALGDDTRCRIVELLGDAPRSVSELVEEFSISQPAVSRHLRVLREADLVEAHRQGRRRIYGLKPAPLDDAERWLEATAAAWAARLARLKEYVEGEEQP